MYTHNICTQVNSLEINLNFWTKQGRETCWQVQKKSSWTEVISVCLDLYRMERYIEYNRCPWQNYISRIPPGDGSWRKMEKKLWLKDLQIFCGAGVPLWIRTVQARLSSHVGLSCGPRARDAHCCAHAPGACDTARGRIPTVIGISCMKLHDSDANWLRHSSMCKE